LKLEIWVAEEYFSVLYKNQNNGYTPPYYGRSPPLKSALQIKHK